jgi:hypothetical protein
LNLKYIVEIATVRVASQLLGASAEPVAGTHPSPCAAPMPPLD